MTGAGFEVVELADMGELAVNITKIDDLSVVLGVLSSVVTWSTVEVESHEDDEGERSEWLILKQVRSLAVTSS